MNIEILTDHEQLSQFAAGTILQVLLENPRAVICVSTGDTPTRTYQLVVELGKARNVDFTQCTLIALDEWVGIPPANSGSCYAYLHHNLIDPLSLRPDQYRLFDALSDNLEEECRKTNAIIQQKGGLDLVVAGVGMNGHIGFNEPGTSLENDCHVIALEPITREVGQKYFTGAMTLKYGITVGLKPILSSKKLMLLASGEKKAAIISRALKGESGVDCPASLVQQHPDSLVILDHAAAALLNAH